MLNFNSPVVFIFKPKDDPFFQTGVLERDNYEYLLHPVKIAIASKESSHGLVFLDYRADIYWSEGADNFPEGELVVTTIEEALKVAEDYAKEMTLRYWEVKQINAFLYGNDRKNADKLDLADWLINALPSNWEEVYVSSLTATTGSWRKDGGYKTVSERIWVNKISGHKSTAEFPWEISQENVKRRFPDIWEMFKPVYEKESGVPNALVST